MPSSSSTTGGSAKITERIIEDIIASQKGTQAPKKGKKPEKEEPILKKAVEFSLKGIKTTTTFSKVFGQLPPSGKDHILPVFKVEDWNEVMRAHIPAKLDQYVWPWEELEMFIVGLIHGDPIFIHGPKGSGKSSMPEQVCATLNIPWVRVNCRQDMETSAIFGGIKVEGGATIWCDGPGAEVARFGGILQIDEISTAPAGINMSLQWALEKPGRMYLAEMPGSSAEKTIPFHPWARIVATDNTEMQGDTSGHYAGTQVQNEALADRFLTNIRLHYLSRAHETAIISERVPELSEQAVKDMLEYAHLHRSGYQEGALQSTVSPRMLINWAEKTAYLGNIQMAFKVCFFNKLTDDDRKVSGDLYYKVFAEELK